MKNYFHSNTKKKKLIKDLTRKWRVKKPSKILPFLMKTLNFSHYCNFKTLGWQCVLGTCDVTVLPPLMDSQKSLWCGGKGGDPRLGQLGKEGGSRRHWLPQYKGIWVCSGHGFQLAESRGQEGLNYKYLLLSISNASHYFLKYFVLFCFVFPEYKLCEKFLRGFYGQNVLANPPYHLLSLEKHSAYNQINAYEDTCRKTSL